MGKLEKIFSEFFGISEDKVKDDIQYQGIDRWDSLNHLSFVSKLEEAYGIDMDMDEITEMSSVGKIREILAKHGVKP